MAQRCEHLKPDICGTVIEVPGGITVEVCASCLRELKHRIDEEQRPETPIEVYAREQEMLCQRAQ